jgi:hypothetical protein
MLQDGYSLQASEKVAGLAVEPEEPGVVAAPADGLLELDALPELEAGFEPPQPPMAASDSPTHSDARIAELLGDRKNIFMARFLGCSRERNGIRSYRREVND